MKTFEQLTFEEKTDAIRFAEYHLVDSIANGILEVELVNPKSQELLEHVMSKSRKMENPRLTKIYLLGEKSIREEIYKLAIVAASGALYDKKGQPLTEGDSK